MRANKVWTPNGYQAGPVNSLVGKGESIIDYTNGTGTLVTKGKVGVDNQPSSVREDDSNVIAGNDIDWSNGMKFSDQVAPLTAKLQMYNNIEKNTNKKPQLSSLSKQTQQLQQEQLNKAKQPILNAMKQITDRQQAQHEAQNKMEGRPMYAEGKSSSKQSSFSRFFSQQVGNGKVPKTWLVGGRLFPALNETAMLAHWLKEEPKTTDIYAANTYAPLALQTMAGNRISPYPLLQQMRLADRTGMYDINQAGGYTGAQRQNARIAQNLGTQRNIAKVLADTEEKNIGYRNAWAQAALSEGAADAARRQTANQYKWEAYNKAHGAKTKGIETHLANLGAMWQKYYADMIKNKQYEDTLNIYQQDVNNRELALQGLFGGTSNNNADNTNIDKQGNTQTSSNNGGNAVNGQANNYSILNQYYTPDGLGGYRFSIINPYAYPNELPAKQRTGRYGTQPDFMPIADRKNTNLAKSEISDPILNTDKMYADTDVNMGLLHHNDFPNLNKYNFSTPEQQALYQWMVNYKNANYNSPAIGTNNLINSPFGAFNPQMKFYMPFVTPGNMIGLNNDYIEPWAGVTFTNNSMAAPSIGRR